MKIHECYNIKKKFNRKMYLLCMLSVRCKCPHHLRLLDDDEKYVYDTYNY